MKNSSSVIFEWLTVLEIFISPNVKLWKPPAKSGLYLINLFEGEIL
jgi:hypothetical protein